MALSVTTVRDAAWKICAALAAVLFFTLLLSLARLESFPLPALAGLGALVLLSALRPSTTLLVLTTVIPVAAWLGRRWDPSVAWAEALVVAFSAGYCARAGVSRAPRSELDLPILASVAVIVASLIVQLLVDGWRFGGTTVRDQLSLLIRQDYFRISGNGDAVDTAMRLLESLLLFKAAATAARANPNFAPLLLRSFVFGAAAAAAVNVLRLWEGAWRLGSPVGVFARYLLTQRFNAHYGDLNAAGSYFVMAAFPAMVLASRQIKRWGMAALLVAAALWIAGSRAAFVAALIALSVPAAVAARYISGSSLRVTRTMATVTAALILLVVGVAMVRYLPARGNQHGPSTAVGVRWELAQTSFRMLAERPTFGVGLGQYYARSGEFSSPELLRIFPPAIHENAHNNFLQMLAELGIVGLAAVLWLLALAAGACVRLVRAEARDPLRWAIVTGLLAFVVSWLGGHPLLIDEPAFAFWILLGAATGWDTHAPPARARPIQWVVAVLLLGIGISIPIRASQMQADFDLEHRGIGLSHWQDEIEGVRYRRAGSTSVVFVSSGSSLCTVPLRAASATDGLPVRTASATDSLKVQIFLDGRLADEVHVHTDRWLMLRLLLPQGRDVPRFHRLEFRLAAPAATDAALMIGKVQVR